MGMQTVFRKCLTQTCIGMTTQWGHVQKRMGSQCGKRQLADEEKRKKGVRGRGVRQTDRRPGEVYATVLCKCCQRQQRWPEGNERGDLGYLFSQRPNWWTTSSQLLHWLLVSVQERRERRNSSHLHRHTNNLHAAITVDVKPIFKNLSKTDILKTCWKGYMQDASECINSIIWKFCPKVKRHRLTVVNTATALRVFIFSDGASSLETIWEELQLGVGAFERDIFSTDYRARAITAQRQALHASKEYRRRRMRLGRDGAGGCRKGRLSIFDRQSSVDKYKFFPFQFVFLTLLTLKWNSAFFLVTTLSILKLQSGKFARCKLTPISLFGYVDVWVLWAVRVQLDIFLEQNMRQNK